MNGPGSRVGRAQCPAQRGSSKETNPVSVGPSASDLRAFARSRSQFRRPNVRQTRRKRASRRRFVWLGECGTLAGRPGTGHAGRGGWRRWPWSPGPRAGKGPTVRRNQWITAVLLAATAGGTVAAGPLAPAVDAAVADASAPPSTDGYRRALLAADTKPDARDEAARRLAAGGTPADARALLDALRPAANALAQAAAARGVATAVTPDPAFLAPLAALLGPNRPVTEPAAAALAAYGTTPSADHAFDALRRFADAGVAGPSQAAAVRAMGGLVDHGVAQYLVGQVTRPDPSPALEPAAADALAALTGEADRGPAGWAAWWDRHRSQAPAQWQAYLLGVRTRQAARQGQLADDVTALLRDDYHHPDATKADRLLRYLSARSAVVRLAGETLVLEAPTAVPDVVARRVRDLVADEDPDVRLAAIKVVVAENDPLAGPPLVGQLSREPDPRIVEQLTLALGKLLDVAAEPALARLVGDPRPAVAKAAANALGEMAGPLKQQRPPTAAADAGAHLRAAITGPRQAAAEDVRKACVVALAALADAGAFDLFKGLLDAAPPESWYVRAAALDGLGVLGNHEADAIVARELGDNDPRVRLAAADAIGSVGRVEQADKLHDMLDPRLEPDRDVREAAWRSLARLLDGGSVDLLTTWVDRFPAGANREDEEHRLALQQDLGRALAAAGPADAAAANDQNVASTLVSLDRPDQAIPYLQRAVDYYRKHGEADTLQNLVEQMLTAQLAARQYAAAADFAGRQLTADPSYQRVTDRTFKAAAEQLRVRGDVTDMNALIAAAKSIRPAVDESTITELQLIRDGP